MTAEERAEAKRRADDQMARDLVDVLRRLVAELHPQRLEPAGR